jgi:hypothetical protein
MPFSRFVIPAAMLMIVGSSAPALAGTVSYVGGQAQWQSTRCTEPSPPASLLAVSSDSSASNINQLMEDYNAYSDQMQMYMNCVSNESQSDADSTSKAIIASAQATIDASQRKVAALHETLSSK